MQNTASPQEWIILFDGVCNLCNASVQWVLLRDHKGKFKYAPLQSDFGKNALIQHGLDPSQLDSVVLIHGARVWLRSDAPLEICRQLGGGWHLLYSLKLIPRSLRDWCYNLVARYRYRWFGRRETCMLPRPEWKGRFLDEG